ncbi:MAG TPA: prepilin-type N-terminal cleavage/methylation domain-containing protein [Polyangiaceae bacterium]|nr:prepilin-type N-terminal cleavage/methylation domain-containing protein [Polyangiaceae bacterium]
MTRATLRAPRRAFTLLEVLVAVAILGLGLTVLLTAQTGLFSSSKRAAVMSEAVGLARCKMGEVEEHLLRDGFQITTEEEEGPCCGDDESALTCKWTIASVMLPDISQMGGADAGTEESQSALSLDGLASAQDELSKGDSQGAMSSIQGMLGSSSGMGSGGPSMGAGALAPIAMGIIWPQLKAMLEASIRKVTVKVVWSEGTVERELSITQYITNPQQGGFLAEDESLGGAGGAGGGGAQLPTGQGGSRGRGRGTR